MIKEEPSISKLYPFPPLKTQRKLDLLFENHWPLKKHYQFCNPNVLLGVEIEVENIYLPRNYAFNNSLGKDNPFYEPDKPFHSTEAAFVAALEDWDSQEWYRQIQAGQ